MPVTGKHVSNPNNNCEKIESGCSRLDLHFSPVASINGLFPKKRQGKGLMSNTDPEPTHEREHHNEELQLLKEFFENYGKPVITSVVAVLIVLSAVHLYRSRTVSRAADADMRLATAQSMTDLESLVADYPSTETAPRALLTLAKLYFDNGSYEIALNKYDQFLSDYPEHHMLDGAVVGRLLCIEARGDRSSLTEAKTGYEAFERDNPDHYLGPQVIFGQARCLEEMGEYADARIIYEDFIAAHPDSPWALRAEDLLESLERKIKKSLPSEDAALSPPLVLAPELIAAEPDAATEAPPAADASDEAGASGVPDEAAPQ